MLLLLVLEATFPETEHNLERFFRVAIDSDTSEVHIGGVLALDAGPEPAAAQPRRFVGGHADDVEGDAVE